MQQPGLYYPFVHIRDDDWLKLAALYWPDVRRLVPSGYLKRDSETARVFAAENILRDEDPGEWVDHVAWDLLTTVSANADRLRHAFSTQRAHAEWDGGATGAELDPWFSSPLGWIHVSKFPTGAVQALTDAGLAELGGSQTVGGDPGDPEDWIGMHPALAGAYMTALAGNISRSLNLQPLTDQHDLRISTASTGVTGALELLLGQSSATRNVAAEEMQTYVMLAMQMARPKHLASVSPQDIVECRRNLEVELTAFRTFVEQQRAELEQLASVPHGRRRTEQFTQHVQETLERPLRDLEKGLELHRIEPTRSLLLASSVAPPLAVSAALEAAGAGGGAVIGATAVAAIGGAWWQVNEARAKRRQESQLSYLIDVRDRLTPKTLASRTRKLMLGTYAGTTKLG